MVTTIIRADGTTDSVRPQDGKFTPEELQLIVQGEVEYIRLNATQTMVVNHKGKLLFLPENYYASLLIRMAGIKDNVVGDVLVCSPDEIN